HRPWTRQKAARQAAGFEAPSRRARGREGCVDQGTPMIVGLALATALVSVSPGSPGEVTVAGARIPVRLDHSGAAVLPASALLLALHGTVGMDEAWAEVTVARQPFRFLIGAPLCVFSTRLLPLAAQTSVAGDTLFLPFQFVAELLPYYLGDRYRYDAR